MVNRALQENVTNGRAGVQETREIKKQPIRQRRLQHEKQASYSSHTDRAGACNAAPVRERTAQWQPQAFVHLYEE